MRYICQALPQRRWMVEELQKTIPQLEVHYDRFRCPLEAFHRCFELAGADPHVHIEDDALPCDDFVANANAAIAYRPDDLIVFFEGRDVYGDPPRSTYLPGSAHCAAVCFYIPEGWAPEYLEWMEERRASWRVRYNDFHLSRWMVATRRSYLCWHPNLVQHRAGKSVIFADVVNRTTRLDKRGDIRRTPYFEQKGWIPQPRRSQI